MAKADKTRYQFTLNGITPLLMHANDVLARDKVEAERKKMRGGKAGDDRSPPSTWKTYLYVSEDSGNVCMPFENLLSMLLQGGMKVRLRGKETLKAYTQFIDFERQDFDIVTDGKPFSRDVIDAIDGDFTEHADKVRGLGFRLSVKPCTIGKTSHVRVRPIFHRWQISGHFEIDKDDAEILTLANLRELWTICGRRIGLGDWRPGPGGSKRPGQYGRFEAEVNKA